MAEYWEHFWWGFWKSNGNILVSLLCQSEPVCTAQCFHSTFTLYVSVFTGERRTVVSCMRIANKSMEVVNNSHCHPENKPHPQVRLCNTHPCQYRWDPHVWPHFNSINLTLRDHYSVHIATTLENNKGRYHLITGKLSQENKGCIVSCFTVNIGQSCKLYIT